MDTVLSLVGLALLDSMSMGTLVIPLALVVRRRGVDTGPMAVYLATVVLVYLALGIGLVAGIDALSGVVTRLSRSSGFAWVTLVTGLVLAVVGIFGPSPRKPEPGTDALAGRPSPTSTPAMIALGLGASLSEAATMAPYLAATSMISGRWAWPGTVAVLAGYCLVMVLPALVLIGATAALGQRFLPLLSRIGPRLEYEAKVTLLWVAALVGIHLTWRSAAALHLIGHQP